MGLEDVGTDESVDLIAAGQAFRGVFRVNASDKREAYVTVGGLPCDVLIKGPALQNRAVEGDEVVVAILDPTKWYRQHRRGSSTTRPTRCSAASHGSLKPGTHKMSQTIVLPSNAALRESYSGGEQQWSWLLSRSNSDRSDSCADLPSQACVLDDLSLAPADCTSTDRANEQCAIATASCVSDKLNKLDLTFAKFNNHQSHGRSSCNGLGENYRRSHSSCWYESNSPAEALSAITAALETSAGESQVRLRPTGQVLGVLRESRKRSKVVGVLICETKGKMLFLVPSDSRLPRCFVSFSALPAAHKKQLKEEAAQPNLACRSIVVGSIVRWDIHTPFPNAVISEVLGTAGDFGAESAALTKTEGISNDQFSQEVLACLPCSPWSITEEEISGRRDLRDFLLFTIDPPTATDLDDALTWEDTGAGQFRVGVHIADVSHFVRAGSALDAAGQSRGNTVYMVQNRVSMLPNQLEQLCSLNPGEDKLAVSVMWDFDKDGHCTSQWLGRSIIRSCAKLSYPVVQQMLDGTFNHTEHAIDLHGKFTWDQVVNAVHQLSQLAQRMRSKRAQRGSLRLDNVKLSFNTDTNGLPCECVIQQQTPAHQLVEELMLKANMSVAQVISQAFPDRCLLRCHPPPNLTKLQETVEQLQMDGFQLDASTSGALHDSLEQLHRSCPEPGVVEAVQLLLTKAMQNAQYFCTGSVANPAGWCHYALAVDRYTHFTSPIRRYPDILVHRMLMAALKEGSCLEAAATQHGVPESEEVQRIAEHCNMTKLAAKSAQDASLKLCLCAMLYQQPVITTAYVACVRGAKFFDVYVPRFGCDVRLFVANIVPKGMAAEWDEADRTLTLSLPSPDSNAISGATSRDCAAASVLQGIHNIHVVRNEDDLQLMALPLRLKAFSPLPVLVSAERSPLSGRFSDLLLRPYIAALSM